MKLSVKEAIAEVKRPEYMEEYLTRTGRPTRQAMLCINPNHSERTGSMSFNRRKGQLHCFGCNANYSLIDLVGLDNGCSDFMQNLKETCNFCGIVIDSESQKEPRKQNPVPTRKEKDPETLALDLQELVEEAHRELMSDKGIKPREHLESRGLSQHIIEEYKIGYSPAGYNAFLKGKYPGQETQSRKEGLYRLILPYVDDTGKYTYFTAEIADRSQIDTYNGKYRLLKGIPAQIFNARYLKGSYQENGEILSTPEQIYICEGIYDALSLEDCGARAIALNGVGNTELIRLCREYKPDTEFIILTDNDAAGSAASERLEEELTAAGMRCRKKELPAGAYKDANDVLRADPEALVKLVYSTREELTKEADAAKKEYELTSVGFRVNEFFQAVEASRNEKRLSTGYPALDELLGGGLYKGLYSIGAISSLGKTAFSLHLLDNIAKAGNDVIIFSLEMGVDELIARSISRETYEISKTSFEYKGLAKSTRGIMDGKRYTNYSKEERDLISKAVKKYRNYAENHVFIYAGIGDIGLEDIDAAIEKHIRLTGRKPVVLVDYLQILKPYDIRATDKQNMDHAVIELKRMSVRYALPILVISSFNRMSYTDPVNLTSFKESGAIEYTCDCVIGLQYNGMDYSSGESEKERDKRIRDLIKEAEKKGREGFFQDIQVKVLKNRNGTRGDTAMQFAPVFNYWKQTEEPKQDIGSDLARDPEDPEDLYQEPLPFYD